MVARDEGTGSVKAAGCKMPRRLTVSLPLRCGACGGSSTADRRHQESAGGSLSHGGGDRRHRLAFPAAALCLRCLRPPVLSSDQLSAASKSAKILARSANASADSSWTNRCASACGR